MSLASRPKWLGRLVILIDLNITQCYCCVILPEFEAAGNLPPGMHWATWDQIVDRYGHTPWRRQLLTGLRASVDELKRVGCSTVYLRYRRQSPKPCDA